jgi:hypothetical protein
MKNHLSLEVDLVHVREFNQELGDGLENKPAEYLPLVSSAQAVAAGEAAATTAVADAVSQVFCNSQPSSGYGSVTA